MKKIIILILILLCVSGCVESILRYYLPWRSAPTPVETKMWKDFDTQWVIRLNGKTYLHQMRESKKKCGVECQFVEIK